MKGSARNLVLAANVARPILETEGTARVDTRRTERANIFAVVRRLYEVDKVLVVWVVKKKLSEENQISRKFWVVRLRSELYGEENRQVPKRRRFLFLYPRFQALTL